MKHIIPSDDWPESWKTSYHYDRLELYGDTSDPGYTCAYNNRRQQTLEMIRSVAKPDARILDVAAAQGNFTLALAELGYEVTWNDLREDLVEYVTRKYESGIVHYAPGNVFDLCFDKQFDVVLLTEIIEHVAHPDQFLQKISQLVKLGGHIILTTPNGNYFRNRLPKFSECADPSQFESVQFKPDADGHIFFLHSDEIESLAHRAGLRVVTSRPHTNPLTRGALKTRALMRILPDRLVQRIERLTASMPMSWQWRFSAGIAAVLEKPVAL